MTRYTYPTYAYALMGEKTHGEKWEEMCTEWLIRYSVECNE